MCAHSRLNDVKPTSRWVRASSSCPQACSNHGTRAIRKTWTSSSAEATSPVSRPEAGEGARQGAEVLDAAVLRPTAR